MFAVTSLVLAGALATLWILSWSRPYVFGFEREATPVGVVMRNPNTQAAATFYSMRGGLDIRYYWRTGSTAATGPREWALSSLTNPKRLNELAPRPTVWNRLGFYWETGTPRGSYFMPMAAGERSHFVFVGAPYWALTILMALGPAGWLLRRWRSGRARRDGACRGCGYSLTGNVSGVCPECGLKA
ncbi:MAG: hypothetical protein JWM97_85 [Phycisphaerales bacterium]|nr:hypothetical protein [Phycisphaerales bacterium]